MNDEEEIVAVIATVLMSYKNTSDEKFFVKSIKRNDCRVLNWAESGRLLSIENRQSIFFKI